MTSGKEGCSSWLISMYFAWYLPGMWVVWLVFVWFICGVAGLWQIFEWFGLFVGGLGSFGVVWMVCGWFRVLQLTHIKVKFQSKEYT